MLLDDAMSWERTDLDKFFEEREDQSEVKARIVSNLLHGLG